MRSTRLLIADEWMDSVRGATTWIGWREGALESGSSAALEIDRALQADRTGCRPTGTTTNDDEESPMTATAYRLHSRSDAYEPFEAGVVQYLRQDDEVTAGIWICSPEEQPGIHEAVFHANETVHILDGRVRVEIVGGPTYELGKGDSASFVRGTTGRWKVLERVTEFFVYS